jgi:hypothetical protein
MCPSYQLKRMFFDILRDRVAQLYSQKAKRSTQRKNLQQFTDQYCNRLRLEGLGFSSPVKQQV